MADEIVAKYRVDVSGASAALDQLAAKTQKTGQTLDDSFNKGSDGVKRLQTELAKQPKTLADLELRLVKLKELLRDDTKIGTEGFKQVTKAINDTNAAIKQANASLAETPKQTNFVTDGLKKIGAAMVAAFAVDKIVSFAKEAITLAANAEGVERAFARIGSPELLAGLRSATRGTVTDLVLMQNAVKANNFQIPLEQLGKLFAFAQSRARATGESVDYLVDSIILGIGRKSIPILDNLGISAVELKDKLGDVSKSEATVGDVAKAVGDIAAESMRKAGVEADTTADKIAQLETAWTNFQTTIGKALISTGIVDATKKSLDNFVLSLKATADNSVDVLTTFTALQFASIFGAKAINEYEKGLNDFNIAATTAAEKARRLQESIDAKNALANQIKNVFFYTEAIKDLNEQINAEGTAVADILPLIAKRTELEEKLKEVIGEETLAMKAKRLAEEELLKIEKKRAEEYNKTQEAEAARLLKQEEDNAKERVKIAEDMAKMLIDIERYLATTSEEVRDFELADNQRFYDSRIEQATKGIGELAKTEEQSAAIFQAIKDEKNKADEESQAAHNQRIFELNKALADRNAALKDAEQEKNEATQKQAIDLIQAGLSTFGSVYNSMMDIAQNASDFELAMLKKKYEEGSISLEFFEAEQIRLQRESAQRAKDAATFNAIIGAAQAAINALSSPGVPFPVALGFSLFAIAAAGAQIAAIQSQPLPQFAKGVVDLQGEGTATSDSIHAKLSKGESVITAKETSKHKGLLEAMNKGLAEKYILSNYVKPALDSAMLSGFADMGKSAELNGLTANLKDHNIIAAMDRNRQATVQGLKLIKQELSKNKRVNIRSKW